MRNDKKINKLISKVLNETLDEKINGIESKLKKDINELGGMSPDVQDMEHPFSNVNFSTMSPEEIKALINKHRKDEISQNEDDFELVDTDFDEEGDDYDEFSESHDDETMRDYTMGRKYSKEEYKDIPLNTGKTKYPKRKMDDDSGISIKRYYDQKGDRFRDEFGFGGDDEDFELTEGSEDVCECGGLMNEGECMECGYKMESYDIDENSDFDYIEEDDMDVEDFDLEKPKNDESTCKWFIENRGEDDPMTIKKCSGLGLIGESLSKKQKKNIDKNKNGRIDAGDFKMLRAMKRKKTETDEEVEEGNAFTGALAKAKREGDDEFKVGGKKFHVKETKNNKTKKTIKLSESQIIDLIEDVILEQKLKSTGGKPRGLQKYEQAHEKSGKENKKNISDVGKKMKDYLKDASKGKYEENPKHFPKGNGELAKMGKKAYVPSDSVKDYVDNLTAAGLENLNYDEIHPNEDWVTKNIEGSSMTGNGDWANSVKTDVNKKRNKIRKDNMLGNIKKKAYNKSPQPIVNDEPGDDSAIKLMAKLESTNEKEGKKLNEEFDRIKGLMGYNRKTQ